MPKIARTARDMIASMTPVLRPGEFVFVTTHDPALVASLSSDAVAMFREDEGVSMVISVALATQSTLSVDMPMRCISLNVFSSLEGVGLTAAVATALGENDIPCNIIAAYYHDHVFVPSDMSDRAMEVLVRLQGQASVIA